MLLHPSNQSSNLFCSKNLSECFKSGYCSTKLAKNMLNKLKFTKFFPELADLWEFSQGILSTYFIKQAPT
ncbi:hypothetical protein [Helicobacter cinaedi]|uniref:hypothetical protein n=1 Tax=Helicobacter cinaedi TaxID=213 RepID=UPI0013151732|nr:hypothetical protein [Helicobacter cinaedi]